MEKSQIAEVLRMVTDALVDLETAKADCKLKIDSAFETYEFTPLAMKALLQIAKAKVKGKVEDVEKATAELVDMLEVVKETREDQ